MLNLTLSTTYGTVVVTEIDVTRTGTSTQEADVEEAILYEDVNGNGDYDLGTDTYIATASYSGGVYTFSSLSITVNGGTEKNLLVMYNISNTATKDVTVGAKINTASDITVTSPDMVNFFSVIDSTNSTIKDSDIFVIENTGETYESTAGGKGFISQGDAGSNFVAICMNRTNSDLYALTNGGEVYRSSDDGQTWTLCGDAFGTPANGIDMTIDNNDDIFLLRTTGYVYQSTDNGVTWVENGDAGVSLAAIEANYTNNDLYATDTGGVLYYSSDSGATWSTRGDCSAENDVADITIDSNNYIHIMEASGEVYRSTDFGDTFSQLSDIGTDTYTGICIDTRYDYIYVIDQDGHGIISVDSGNNWRIRSDIGAETDYEDITCYVHIPIEVNVSGTDKAPTNVQQGQNEIVMLNITLTADEGTATVTQIEVNRTGTSTTTADIAEATLWHDVNNDGDYDDGTDILLGAGTYSDGNYVFSGLSFDVEAGTPEKLLIIYNISSSATTGVTVGARIDGSNNITLQGSDTVESFSPIQSTNSTIQGNTLSVEGTDKAPSNVYQAQELVVMLNLTLTSDSGSVTLTELDVNRTGSSVTEGDISQATLWHDVNNDGDYDDGTDVLLGSGTYSNGVYNFSGLSFDIVAGTPEKLLVIYNISSSANTGVTVGARIDGADNITLSGSDTVESFSPIQSTNSTINGNQLNVYGENQNNGIVFQGEGYLEILNITLTADYGSVTVTQINVTKTGTSTQEGDISQAILYEDVNGDGDYDSGTDTYIATATYSSGVYSFSSLSITVNSGTDKDLLVMYNISSSATTGVTVGAKITGESDILVSSPDSVGSFSTIASSNATIRDSDIFVIEVTGEVYESTDGGKSFSYMGDPGTDFEAICMNRSNTDLYALMDSGDIYRSTDYGETWNYIGDAVNKADVVDMTIDSNGNIYVLRSGGQVHVSTDNGASFTEKGDAGGGTVGIEANITNNDIYVVDSGGDISYSSDGGDTWTTRGDASSGNDVEDIAIDSNDYIFVLEGSGEVYRSTNNGDTFSQLSDIGTDSYVGICVDCRYDYIYVVADDGLVYLSTDGGSNWVYRSDIGSETDYQDITCYVIPEFNEILIPIFMIPILLIVWRKRSRVGQIKLDNKKLKKTV